MRLAALRGLLTMGLAALAVLGGADEVVQAPTPPSAEAPNGRVMGKPAGEQPQKAMALLLGQVSWPGVTWFPGGHVTLARDQHFSQVVATLPLGNNGRFAEVIEPGMYYLRAVVDLDGNGKVSPGDGLGFYGADDPSKKPEPIDLSAESELDLTVIRVLFQFSPEMKLVRAKEGLRAAVASVRGNVEVGTGTCYVVLWSTSSNWFGYASKAGADGAFQVSVPPGPYALAAFRDANDDGLLEVGEPAGLLRNEAGEVRELSVWPGALVDVGRLEMAGGWQVPPSGAGPSLWLPEPPAIMSLVLGDEETAAAPRVVTLFADAKLSQIVVTANLWPEVLVALSPATYYLVCGLDLNEDGRIGPGDLLATTGEGTEASPVSVRAGQILAVTLEKTARISEEMLKEKGREN